MLGESHSSEHLGQVLIELDWIGIWIALFDPLQQNKPATTAVSITRNARPIQTHNIRESTASAWSMFPFFFFFC